MEGRITMTITLELTPEEEARLRAEAEKSGKDLADFARARLLESGAGVEAAAPAAEASPDAESQALIGLLQQWRAEDAAMSPEEAEQAEGEWEELRANLNANRAVTAERLPFP